MKWLVCLILMWHVDHFYLHLNSPLDEKGLATAHDHFCDDPDKAVVKLLNKEHAVQATIIKDGANETTVIWAEDYSQYDYKSLYYDSDHKNPVDGSWYPRDK